MSSGLAQRVATAIIVAPLALFAVYLKGTLLTVLTLFVLFMVLYEFFSFSTQQGPLFNVSLSITLTLPALGYLFFSFDIFTVATLTAISLVFLFTILVTEFSIHEYDFSDLLSPVSLGIAYPFVFGTSLVLAADTVSREIIFWFIAVIAFADTFAYFGGKAIGGPKLAPRISPGKTISGTIVGLLFSVLGSYFVLCLFSIEAPWFVWGGFGLLIGLLSVFGDLLESLVKRTYGVKDSGSILPGHGGILDRVDGYIFCSPALLFISNFMALP